MLEGNHGRHYKWLVSLTTYFQFDIVIYEIDSNVSNPKQWDNLSHDPINGSKIVSSIYFVFDIPVLPNGYAFVIISFVNGNEWMEIVHEIATNQSSIEIKLSQFVLQMWTQMGTIHGNSDTTEFFRFNKTNICTFAIEIDIYKVKSTFGQ